MSIQAVSFRGVLNFFLVSLFLLFEMGVQVTPNVMAPMLMKTLHLTAGDLSFLSSVYFYSYSIMMLPVGLLYDRFRVQTLLVIALITLAIGTALFGLANGWLPLLFSRILMGFGSSFAFIGVLVVANRWFAARHFALLVGITQLMAAIGGMLGQAPVALLVDHIGWHQTSFYFSGFALFLAFLIASFVRSDVDKNKRLSWQGIKVSLFAVLSKKQSYVVAMYAFLSWGPVVIFAELWGASFLTAKYGLPIVKASMSAMAVWFGIAVSAPLLGYLLRYFNHKTLMFWSMVIAALAAAVLIYVPDLSFTIILLLSVVIGFGAAAQIMSFDLVRANNANDKFGLAIGFNNFGVVLGGAILQPLAGFLLDIGGAKVGHIANLHQFYQAMWLIPACFFMGALLSRALISYQQVGKG